MGLAENKEQAGAFAAKALTWMAQHGIPPIPENIELIYSYVAGENAELKRAVDRGVQRGDKFESGEMAKLCERYIPKLRGIDVISDVSADASVELWSILQLVESACRDQSEYEDTLSSALKKLSSKRAGKAAVKDVVEGLIDATRTIEERFKQLRKQFLSSSYELDDLQEKLKSVRLEMSNDQLTGICNRKAIDIALQAAIGEASDTKEPLSLIMYDVDHLKQFNDIWGRRAGDEVLCLIGSCLIENIKGRDTAGRYGGDKFAVILPSTTLADATLLAEDIRHKIQSQMVVKNTTVEDLGAITVSAGVVKWRSDQDAADLMQRANAYLSAVKNGGGNCVVNETNLEAILASA